MDKNKPKTKIKKLKLTSVDMVRRGANQDAYINLYKSDNAPEDSVTDEIPQSLWKSIKEVVKGFMKQNSDDEQVVKNEPDNDENLKEVYTSTLNKSLDSIVDDETTTLEKKLELAEQTIGQFTEKYTEMCAELIKSAKNKQEEEPEDDDDDDHGEEPEDIEEPEDDEPLNKNSEGDRDMKIDKSKFTAEELSQYEALIAKGLVEDDAAEESKKKVANDEKAEDAEKKLHPEVAKALEELETMKKSIEMDEMKNIAKKYSALGKKEDELANTLYEMKKSNSNSYNEYIAVLDQNLDLVNKSGLFEEIGKSGRGVAGGSTLEKIENIASDIQKSDVNLSRVEAINKAWEQHPELIAEYEKEYK